MAFNPELGSTSPAVLLDNAERRISWLMVPPQMFPTVVVTLFIHGAR